MSILNIRVGDVVRMRNFEHHTHTGMRIGYKVKNKIDVGMFLFLGHEPKDGSEPLDLHKIMDQLGWMLKPEFAPNPPKQKQARKKGPPRKSSTTND